MNTECENVGAFILRDAIALLVSWQRAARTFDVSVNREPRVIHGLVARSSRADTNTKLLPK